MAPKSEAIPIAKMVGFNFESRSRRRKVLYKKSGRSFLSNLVEQSQFDIVMVMFDLPASPPARGDKDGMQEEEESLTCLLHG